MSKHKEGVRREGFWYSEREPELPIPVGNEYQWMGQDIFMAALQQVQDDDLTKRTTYRGFSRCRICDNSNGCTTFNRDGWEWPSGLMHYIRIHNLRPSNDFREFIYGLTQKAAVLQKELPTYKFKHVIIHNMDFIEHPGISITDQLETAINNFQQDGLEFMNAILIWTRVGSYEREVRRYQIFLKDHTGEN